MVIYRMNTPQDKGARQDNRAPQYNADQRETQNTDPETQSQMDFDPLPIMQQPRKLQSEFLEEVIGTNQISEKIFATLVLQVEESIMKLYSIHLD